ncbi:hypothetical protein Zm00014a_014522 [Zea mays]|uniref:Uncharacterized protein n=1 Tax=Zea mays TaxID=4577 RepID=A0A3L6EYS1_MAIZE|nr:hypothetical protein Zm00014a_014522 [Zea mays]
MDNLCVYCE